MDTDFLNVDAFEKQFDNTIGGRFSKKIKQRSTDSTTKDIVYISMIVSLIFPIMMAIFLVMTLRDIDFGESRESCTAPFFTNPGTVTQPQPAPGSQSDPGSVNVGSDFDTLVKIPGRPGGAPLKPFPCMK